MMVGGEDKKYGRDEKIRIMGERREKRAARHVHTIRHFYTTIIIHYRMRASVRIIQFAETVTLFTHAYQSEENGNK